MSIAAPLLVGLPSRQGAPQVPLMRAHLILEGASSPRAACLPRYSFDKVGDVRAQAWRRRRRPLHSRDRPRQACSFRLSFSCGEHAPARRARSLYSILRIIHVADSSAVFGACWWCCFKCAGAVIANAHANQQHSMYSSHTHACTSHLFVASHVPVSFFTVC